MLPESFVETVHVRSRPLPPLADRVMLARGASVVIGAEMVRAAPTVMLTVALFPNESLTCTTSVTAPVAPAV
jgi:hypothetical protein